MLIHICKSKIAHLTVTEAELWYEGSITIDETLLKAADILPGEKVNVLNVNNGERFETYAIAGKVGSGIVCLNGPAARLGVKGDQLIVLTYALAERKEAASYVMKVVKGDSKNKIAKNKSSA